jgi:3,4-dihydroxy 2-butanone 4-phosphate synthase/GTP cyclohydrolase II
MADRTPAGHDLADAERAVDALSQGEFVVLADSRAEDASASLMLGAQFATPERVAFLSKHAYGLIRLCLTDERCRQLQLEPIVGGGDEWRPTVSICARGAGPTGASAEDRALTIALAIDESKGPADFVQPGHVFPLRARRGGVLERPGRTEAAVDLARLAGLMPAAAISLVVDDRGIVVSGDRLAAYCRDHGFPLVTISEVRSYRRAHEPLLTRVASAKMPTAHGDFRAVAFRERVTGAQHLALVMGAVADVDGVLVSLHGECVLGDVFRTTTCSCRRALELSLERISAEGAGVLVYMIGAHESRRLVESSACSGRPLAIDDFAIAAQILGELGLTSVRMLTRQQDGPGLDQFGLRMLERVPLASMSDIRDADG